MSKDVQLSVRIPVELLARLDAMVTQLGAHDTMGPLGVSRNGAIRLALVKGLNALQTEYDPETCE